jgi:hypothetical protein
MSPGGFLSAMAARSAAIAGVIRSGNTPPSVLVSMMLSTTEREVVLIMVFISNP